MRKTIEELEKENEELRMVRDFLKHYFELKEKGILKNGSITKYE